MCLNLRAGGGQRTPELCQYLDQHDPSIVVLTEWRDNQRGRDFEQWATSRRMRHAGLADGGTANGVFVASRLPFITKTATPANKGTGVLMLVQFKSFTLLACYFPSLIAKAPFFARCSKVAKARRSQPFLMLGDLNTGNQNSDRVENAVRYTCSDAFDALNSKHGLHDLWRRANGIDAREWTWLSHRQNGFRIDHAFGNEKFLDWAQPTCHYDHTPRENRWTDHSAVIVGMTR
jgi:exodeoxyribonuclease III